MSCLLVAPSFDRKQFEDTRRLKAGTSTVIEIPFQAHPMPTVVWKFKNGELPDSRRFREDTIMGMTSLSMSKVHFICSLQIFKVNANLHGLRL